MYSLPTVVTIENLTFHITNNGDFRMVLDCFSALNDEELSEDYRVLACLLIFYEELNSVDDVSQYSDILELLVKEMYAFFQQGETVDTHKPLSYTLLDWEGDSQMICAAINNVAHTEVRALPYLHWWTFMGYYMSIGESLLATVVNIRGKIKQHKKLEKWEQDFKRDNPQYFVWKSSIVQDRDAENLVRELWGKE